MDDKLTFKEKRDLVLEAGLQALPYVGGSLATLYFGAKQEKRFKRIESFYRELAKELEDLKVNLLPIHKHDEDKIIAIIEELNERIEREHLEEKRRYFKNFLRNALQTPTKDYNFDERKYFLDTLSIMSLLECELMMFLTTIQNAIEIGSIEKRGTSQYAIVGAVGRLVNYGFVRQLQGKMIFGPQIDNTLYQLVELSDFGRKFIDFCLK